MAKKLLDRLKYYKPRKVWRLRYPGKDGREATKTFGPTGVELDDTEAQAQAITECKAWIQEREAKAQSEAHRHQHNYESSKALDTGLRAFEQIMQLGEELGARNITRSEYQTRVAATQEEMAEGLDRYSELATPQLQLLGEIEKLRTRAARATELESEVTKLQEENTQLRSIVVATGRSAASSTGPLQDLAEKFIKSKQAEMTAKGRQAKTMQPIASSARLLVDWLGQRSDPIKTSAELEGQPHVLADYRDEIMEQLAAKSCGWARKRLDGPKHFIDWMVKHGYLAARPRSMAKDWMSVGVDEPNPTFFTKQELRTLWSKAKEPEIQIALLLGMNCAYREADILTLQAKDIYLEDREIRRVRNKSKRHGDGSPQCHRLWKTTVATLQPWLSDNEPTPLGSIKNISGKLNKFIDNTLKGNTKLPKGERRTAKSLRSTASQMVEDITGGNAPHLAVQMLGDKDPGIGKHYRRRNYEALYQVIDQMEEQLGI